MALIVQKFGGTSLGSPERIRAVAKRIAAAQGHGRHGGNRVVVVVSAMGHTTDELIGLAHQVSEDPPHREMDMLLTAGERISMALVSMALADLGVAAVSFTGSQSGIITDSSHRRARIRRILGDRVREALSAGKIAIVAGFQGVSETKEVTTLGRGGSDTTAVALAAALQADLCEIYTDVDGVYSSDPRVVPGARLWKKLPLSLMVEMATRGAGVLHPRSVELAQQYGVALCVRNSLNDHEGTSFMVEGPAKGLKKDSAKGLEDFQIACVTGDVAQIFIEVELARPTVAAAVWDRASQDHLSVLTPVFSQNRLEFFGEREALSDWNRHLSDLAAQGFVVGYRVHDDLSPLSVVGHRLTQDGTALHEIMGVLSREQIGVTSASASALAVTLSVSSLKLDDAVRALHQHFLGN